MSIDTLPGGNRLRQSGFSLIEVVVFIVIVSVGVTGLMSVMNATVKHSADPMLRKQAVAMAEAILDEVMAKDYANPTGGFTETSSTCANRSQYDDVGDYTCFAGPPFIAGTDTLSAAPISALASYSAKVAIISGVDVGGIAMKKITVTVTGGTEPIELYGYRASY